MDHNAQNLEAKFNNLKQIENVVKKGQTEIEKSTKILMETRQELMDK